MSFMKPDEPPIFLESPRDMDPLQGAFSSGHNRMTTLPRGVVILALGEYSLSWYFDAVGMGIINYIF